MPRSVAAPPVPVPALELSGEAQMGDHIIAAEWSPDGKRVATATVSGPVAIWDSGGQLVRELPGHKHGTFAVSWSAGGELLATGGQDGTARVWDAATGEPRQELDAGASWVEHVAFSPLGDFLVTAAGRQLKLWKAGGELVHAYGAHPSTIASVAWQPGALYFASAAYGQLATFGVDKPEPVKSFAWKGSILVVAWSPDGNYMATGNQDASVHFWYRKSGRDLEMTGYPAKIRELSWDTGSRYLATGGSPVVTIWDCGGKGPAGTRPIQLQAHEVYLSAVAYQRNGGLLASGCRAGWVYVWNQRKPDRPLRGARLDGAITQLCWAPADAHLAATTERGMLRIFRRTSQA